VTLVGDRFSKSLPDLPQLVKDLPLTPELEKALENAVENAVGKNSMSNLPVCNKDIYVSGSNSRRDCGSCNFDK